MNPLVTTVVATQNRWPQLSETLPHHDPPVILVDNGSTDGTAERVRDVFPDIRVLRLSRNLGAVARNLGVQAARTPYVAFADDDSWWEPGALSRAADLFEDHERLGLLAGRVLVGDEGQLDPTCVAMAHSPLPRRLDLPGPSVLGFLACGAVVRRVAFLEAGGFDAVVGFFGEEERLAVDLAARGWGLAYVDSVVAHHHPSSMRPPAASRRALGVRNALLTAVMRRPWSEVGRLTVDKLREGPVGAVGVARALPRLPRALAARHPAPSEVEAALRMLRSG